MCAITTHVIVLFALFGVSSTHLCMFSPAQRGSLQGFNKPGAPDCFLVKGQCGGRPMSSNAVIIKSNQNFTVVIQKNLDHWTKSTPGKFEFSIGSEGSQQMKSLGIIPDRGEPSLTLYALNVTIPPMMAGNYVIQSQYVTMNPDAPAVFYQCADVAVVNDF